VRAGQNPAALLVMLTILPTWVAFEWLMLYTKNYRLTWNLEPNPAEPEMNIDY
jgi:hypothetical protein